MLWRLQYRALSECEGEWEDVDIFLTCQPLKKFSSLRDAFEYFFGKHAHQRSPERLQYRLAPEFSTKPVEVTFTPEPPMKSPGTWETCVGSVHLVRRVR